MRRWVATLATVSGSLVSKSCSQSNSLLTCGVGQAKHLRSVPLASIRQLSTRGGAEDAPAYTTLSDPAPGSPFHHAFPVHSLQAAKEFYGNVIGCQEGRSSEKWQDYSLHGHQIVCHWVGNDYRCQDFYNPVDGDEVPVPHFGLALTVEQFHALADRVRKAGIEFIIEPHLRFHGMPGEQVRVSLRRIPHC